VSANLSLGVPTYQIFFARWPIFVVDRFVGVMAAAEFEEYEHLGEAFLTQLLAQSKKTEFLSVKVS